MEEKNNISRRNFIIKSAKLSLGAFSIPLVPSIFHADPTLSPSILSIAVGKVAEAQLVEKAIEQIGGMKKFVKRGDIVVIKPNLVLPMYYKFAVTTNPFVVKKVIRMCLDAGAKKVKIVENPAGLDNAHEIFKIAGITKVCKETGAGLVFPGRSRFKEMKINGKVLKKYPVFIDCIECDKLINIPIVKDHLSSKLSCAMKNFFGAVGGIRSELHIDLHQSIVDLANYFKPALTIVDAVRILKRNGPFGGSFKDVAMKYTITASTDIVASEAYAAKLLNLSPASVDFIRLATEQKLGNSDFSKIKEILTTL